MDFFIGLGVGFVAGLAVYRGSIWLGWFNKTAPVVAADVAAAKTAVVGAATTASNAAKSV